jgi:hypothetical protein
VAIARVWDNPLNPRGLDRDRLTDWTHQCAGRLPDGNPWRFQDHFAGKEYEVNPAIVHAMRSKDALAAHGAPAA